MRASLATAISVVSSMFFVGTGCSTMTLRTGVVVIGTHPAFQASAEFGPSVMGKRHGVTATHEWGVVANDGERATHGMTALNLDAFELDPETGPVMRIGARLRGEFTEPTSSLGVEARGAMFTTSYVSRKTMLALGVELAGGVMFDPSVPVYEANVVAVERVDIW